MLKILILLVAFSLCRPYFNMGYSALIRKKSSGAGQTLEQRRVTSEFLPRGISGSSVTAGVVLSDKNNVESSYLYPVKSI